MIPKVENTLGKEGKNREACEANATAPQNQRGGVDLGNEGPRRSAHWKKLISEDRALLDEADDARRAVGFYEVPSFYVGGLPVYLV
jgi:hypothetical protein